MTEIKSPHDALFKARFSRRPTAIAFCRHYLPPEIVALLDLDSLEVVKESFSDEALRQHFSDMLYQIALRTGGTAHLHILLEHKSWPDQGVALQIARYQMQKWAELWNDHAPRLPVILPVVLYHGKQKWNVPRNFAAMFNLYGPAAVLRPFVPDFYYYLCDLSKYNELTGGPELEPLFQTLKFAFRRGLKANLLNILQQAARLEPLQEAQIFLETLTNYWRATKQLKDKEIAIAMNELLPGYSHIKTPWIEQWRDEGRHEGTRKASEAIVLALLRHRFQTVNEQTVTQIRALSTKQLQELSVAVLDFKKVADLSRWLRNNAPAVP